MKRILSTIMVAAMMVTGVPTISVGANAADDRLLWATVSNGNTHLLPGGYQRAVKDFERGKLVESFTYSDWAWKNDYVSSRIDLVTLNKSIPAAKLVVADLVSKDGGKISKDNVTATYLREINTLSYDYSDIDYDVFDIITRDTEKDLEAGTISEAWVQFFIPEDAKAGTYTTTLSVVSEGKPVAKFNYSIEVIDLTLPDSTEFETYLDLWTYPYASNRHYSGQTTEEYFDFVTPGKQDTNPMSYYYVRLDEKYQAGLESELALYAKAGGDTITTTLVEDPWNSRYPCPCPSMVKWTRHKDGTFSYDYTDFDHWVELNMKYGIDDRINMFFHAGVGWGFVCYDEATGKVTNNYGGQPGTDGWYKIGTDFLTDLTAHLEEKGWFDIACIYMDERGLEVTKSMIELASRVKNSEGKSLKVGGAVNAGEVFEVMPYLYDITIWENAVPDNIEELAEERRAGGQMTNIYTCGAGKMANTCPPAEAAYAVYHSYSKNTDGILRWALNKYDYDPLHAEIHDVCYPGDCYLIYPDESDSETMQAMSTPRFEKLCEGMRDVEKMRILSEINPEFEQYVGDAIASLGKNDTVTEVGRMRTRILSMSRAAIALQDDLYTDVKAGAWYEKAVNFAIINGFMNGVSATRFDPNGSMTRAMFVTVLARLDGAEVDNNATSVFKDVPSGQWYTGAIAWATKNGLLYGVGDGKFDPSGILTREQTATLLLRYAKDKKYNVEERADITGYADYDKIGSYAVDAFSWANAKGIIKGVSATKLDPKGKCTRAQVSEMFRLFCQNVENQ